MVLPTLKTNLQGINKEGGSTKNTATNEHTQLYMVRLKQRSVVSTHKVGKSYKKMQLKQIKNLKM